MMAAILFYRSPTKKENLSSMQFLYWKHDNVDLDDNLKFIDMCCSADDYI